MKVRIAEREFNGKATYVIQQKHRLFGWRWADAWENSMSGAWYNDSFDTLEEAMKNLPYFDGTKCREKVIIEKEEQQ
jgi:hypothetical protein